MMYLKTKYGWKNPWKTIEVSCPWCNASQTVDTVVTSCFYCRKKFWVGVDGIPEKAYKMEEPKRI